MPQPQKSTQHGQDSLVLYTLIALAKEQPMQPGNTVFTIISYIFLRSLCLK